MSNSLMGRLQVTFYIFVMEYNLHMKVSLFLEQSSGITPVQIRGKCIFGLIRLIFAGFKQPGEDTSPHFLL